MTMKAVRPAKGATKGQKSASDLFMYAAIFATVLSIAYWTAYASNAYNTFHEYADVGMSAFNMYYYIHYSGNVTGLQWLVFADHVSPIQLLIALPVFYIDQSVMTLLVMQAVLLSLSGLLLFFIVRDLLKSGALGLLFCLGLLLSPAMHGMLIFDYHAESFILPFYLLTFYFFMKARVKPFVMSSLLLICTIEEAPFLSLTLGIGLLLYVVLGSRDGSRSVTDAKLMMRMALGLIAISVIALFAYYATINYLIGTYATYPQLPMQLQVYPFLQDQIKGVAGASIANGPLVQQEFLYAYVPYGLALALLGFGLTVAMDPIILLLLASPWLTIGLLLRKYVFFYVFDQYFSYVLGGTIVAAVLGWMMLMEKRGIIVKALLKVTAGRGAGFLPSLLVASFIVVNLLLILLSPIFTLSGSTNNLSQDFLFLVTPQQQVYYSQLRSMIALIPSNASVVAQNFMMAHLSNREYIEQLEPGYGYFVPQYVLVDFNENVSEGAFMNDQYGVFKALVASNYTLYASNGTAMLYCQT